MSSVLTFEQKVAARGLLDLQGEFCPWAGISAAFAYAEIRAGRLKLTKIGRSAKVAVDDAFAWRDLHRRATDGANPSYGRKGRRALAEQRVNATLSSPERNSDSV